MTTHPNQEMESIHDRIPVLIDRKDYDMWLNSDNEDDIRALLQPLPRGLLQMHEVSTDVNVVKNNSNELILTLNSM